MAPIGQLLVASGTISQKQLDEALQCQVLFGGSIGTNLMELGYVSEPTLASQLAAQLGIETPPIRELERLSPEITSRIPAPLAAELCAVPMREEGGALLVAMADPRDPDALRRLKEACNSPIRPLLVAEARLAYLLEKYYGLRREQRYINLIRNLSQQGPAPAPPAAVPKAASRPAAPPPPAAAPERFDRMQAGKAPARRQRQINRAELDEMLGSAKTRDDVAQIILAYAQGYLRRACLLVVKRDAAYGWAGYGENVDPSTVRGIMIPLSQPSIFKTVDETRSPFLGPAAETPVNKRFLAAFGGLQPQTVVTVPIAYGENPIALLYGDNGAGKGVPPGHVADLQVLSDKVAQAFQKIIERLRRRA